jgi:hypothetical protein
VKSTSQGLSKTAVPSPYQTMAMVVMPPLEGTLVTIPNANVPDAVLVPDIPSTGAITVSIPAHTYLNGADSVATI